MTEKQEIRAWALFSAALMNRNNPDRETIGEEELLYEAEFLEPVIEKSKDKKITAFSLAICAIIKDKIHVGTCSNLPSFADKIEKYIEQPEKYTTKIND
jgi:hypothetical protein